MIWFILSLLFCYRHVYETVLLTFEPVNESEPCEVKIRLTHVRGMCS